jgi:hypothetical protein
MKRCFILGGGPSLKDVDLSPIKHEYIIAINEAYRFGKFVTTWFFADSSFYKNHKQDIQKWPNKIVSCSGAAKNDKKVEYYQRCKKHMICFEPGKLAFPNGMANSGATAINLAIRKGFDTIILLGFDMQFVDGRANYHDYYKKKKPRQDIYNRFMLHFEAIAKETDKTIINANLNSALTCFPKIELKDILANT